MKQKDIILIIVVVFVSGVISILTTKFFVAPPKNRQQTVEVVAPITSDFPQPDTKYFNDKAVDPTKNISIGDSTNPRPFNTQ